MTAQILLPMIEGSQVGDARRRALGLARIAGFGEAGSGALALVVTEAARNCVLHARGGEIILRLAREEDSPAVDVIALDHGPGMKNLPGCREDGYSTVGTPGTGLGAIARMSGVSDLYSDDSGTVLWSRVWGSRPPQDLAGLEIGAICLPVAGEEACGDAWAIRRDGGRVRLLLADGLGHGPSAAEASREAVRILAERGEIGAAELMEEAHLALRSTRGAALAITDVEGGTVTFSGVGNIAGRVISRDSSRVLLSLGGTVGHEIHNIRALSHVWAPDVILVLHSDGLGTQWSLERYPGLSARRPGVIAGILYRDFRRERDDVTVVVARDRSVL